MIDIQLICRGLKLGEDGIWYSGNTQILSYPSDGNDACFAVEEESFWFKHRNNCIITIVKLYPPEADETIFDIGGGNGFVSSALTSTGFNVALVEPGPKGASNAKRRGLETVICATTDTACFKSHSISAVGLFDVVEHVKDDLKFLKSIRILMKQGGYLYLTVPAYSYLWSNEDVSAGHFRRYSLRQICNVINHAGFMIEFSSYIFRFLPIPIALFRVLPYRLGFSQFASHPKKLTRDHTLKNRFLARISDAILNSEIINLRNNVAMRFGGSCLVVAKCSGN